MKKVDYSFKILEEILTLKEYSSREEVIKVGETMLKIAENGAYSDKIKAAYKEAMNKLNGLSFDEMKEIINILAEEDDDEDEEDDDEEEQSEQDAE